MRKAQIYIAEIPAVSHDFARDLDKRFPAKAIKPGVTQDELLYNAGQRSVIEFILSAASGTVISGDANDLKPQAHEQSLLDKLLGVVRR